MKATKIEKKILDFITRHLDVLFIIAITIFSLIIRFMFRNFVSNDYSYYTKNWMLELHNNGGIYALKNVIGNYNQPYLFLLVLLTYLPIKSLYSIKILSIIFDYGMSLAAVLLVNNLFKNKKEVKLYRVLTYAIIIMIPTIILNSSAWGQCDSIYTMFALLSLAFLVKDEYMKSFIFLGVSFAFKLQFIFLLPLYVILYFKEKKFSIINFLWLPIVNIVLCLPSILMGHPFLHCFTVFFEQVGYYKKTTMGMPNIYTYMPNKYEYVAPIGISLLFLTFALIMYVTLRSKKQMKKDNIITLGLLSICLCIFLLPCMHDRYLFMGDVLSVIWYLQYRKWIWIPIGLNGLSLCCYVSYLFKFESLIIPYLPILFFIIIVKLMFVYFDSLKDENW